MTEKRSFEGRVAVVTGAASGMGAATARAFAEAGACVLVADIDEQNARATAESITDAAGVASYLRVDVSDPGDVAAMVEAAVDRYGRIDCAVNNAAVGPDTRPIVDLDWGEFARVLSVNLTGVAACMKYEMRQFEGQGSGGAIVNIGSTSSYRPQPNNAAYVAAKHGVIGLTKAGALEGAESGIRVNAICPGAIDTPMLQRAVETRGATEGQFISRLSLLGRLGDPSEVAHASLWLCSDQASFITGASLPVDAGYLAR